MTDFSMKPMDFLELQNIWDTSTWWTSKTKNNSAASPNGQAEGPLFQKKHTVSMRGASEIKCKAWTKDDYPLEGGGTNHHLK